jgi:hypothetical protein
VGAPDLTSPCRAQGPQGGDGRELVVTRWPALVLVPALIAVALLVDSDDSKPSPSAVAAEASTELTRMMPVASAPDALASTWYCAAGTAEEGGAANQTVIVYNPTDRPTTGTITAVPNKGAAKAIEQEVPARGQVRLALMDLVHSAYASAVVEFRGGEVAVEHLLRGPEGVDAGPCATSASDQWQFAAGATTLDASEVIVLFNPFPAPATVDIAFSFDDGERRTPGPFQGLQVPAGSVVAASTKAIKLRPAGQVSATVVARSGQVVAERIQTFDGTGPGGPDAGPGPLGFKPKGLAVTLGVPRPSIRWMFPFGAKDKGLHERYVIFNPGPDEAEVSLALTLADAKRNGQVDPFTVTINPQSSTVVDMDSESRIPTRVFHAAVLTSENQVPVVAERVISSTDPLETHDIAISPGTPLVADRWIFPAGGNVTGQLSEWIAVMNPGPEKVEVQLGAVIDAQVQALPESSTFTLGPHEHRRVALPKKLTAERITVQVFGDHPVAAERVLLRPEGARTSTSIGIPAGDAELRLVPATAAG